MKSREKIFNSIILVAYIIHISVLSCYTYPIPMACEYYTFQKNKNEKYMKN